MTCGAVEDAIALGGADRETGEVVFARRIHARHLRRLAADQRAARVAAGLRDAFQHRLGDPGFEFARREIIEKKQRLSALNDEIVDAHRDEVDADRVVPAGGLRDLELGADAVGGRDQDRIGETRRLEVEQRAEAAEARRRAGAGGGAGQRLDRLDQGIAGIDVDARRPVVLARILARFRGFGALYSGGAIVAARLGGTIRHRDCLAMFDRRIRIACCAALALWWLAPSSAFAADDGFTVAAFMRT